MSTPYITLLSLKCPLTILFKYSYFLHVPLCSSSCTSTPRGSYTTGWECMFWSFKIITILTTCQYIIRNLCWTYNKTDKQANHSDNKWLWLSQHTWHIWAYTVYPHVTDHNSTMTSMAWCLSYKSCRVPRCKPQMPIGVIKKCIYRGIRGMKHAI